MIDTDAVVNGSALRTGPPPCTLVIATLGEGVAVGGGGGTGVLVGAGVFTGGAEVAGATVTTCVTVMIVVATVDVGDAVGVPVGTTPLAPPQATNAIHKTNHRPRRIPAPPLLFSRMA